MKKELKNPMGILLGSLETFKAAVLGEVEIKRKTALTTEIKGFTVDTCNTVDAGWETGIKPTDEIWVIVERYPDQKSAKTGHDKWVKSLTDNPEQELRDMNYSYEED